MAVAIIPARGGSKRVPRKNIRRFGGRPILHWSIDAARAANVFDRILVSTEDPEIAEIARAGGAEVPRLRDAGLADDQTGILDVMADAVAGLNGEGLDAPGLVCLIYPTAPFLEPGDLVAGRDALAAAPGMDYALSVSAFGFPIQRALRRGADGGLTPFQPDYIPWRSQDLEPAFHDAAQFAWGRAAAWAAKRPLMDRATLPVEIPRHRVQDIDTADDWRRAELMWAALRGEKALGQTALDPAAKGEEPAP